MIIAWQCINPDDTDFMGYASTNKVRRQYKKYAKGKFLLS